MVYRANPFRRILVHSIDIRGVDIIYYLPVYPCSGGAQLGGGGGEVPGEDGGGGNVGGGHGKQDEAGHTHQLVVIVGSAEINKYEFRCS